MNFELAVVGVLCLTAIVGWLVATHRFVEALVEDRTDHRLQIAELVRQFDVAERARLEVMHESHEAGLRTLTETMHLIKAATVNEAVHASATREGMSAETHERIRYAQIAAEEFERQRKKTAANGKHAEKVVHVEDENKEYDIIGG